MERDAGAVRGSRPFVLTNCFTGAGLDEVVARIETAMKDVLVEGG
jgi:urease accessory protein